MFKLPFADPYVISRFHRIKDVLSHPKWSLDLLSELHKRVTLAIKEEEKATEDRIRYIPVAVVSWAIQRQICLLQKIYFIFFTWSRIYTLQQREKLREYISSAEKDKNLLFNAVCASLKRQGMVPAIGNEVASTTGGVYNTSQH